MGIRGLQNYLATKLDGVVLPTTLPVNATLVIDGDGWVFQLLETSHDFRPELGGCYNSLEESIAAEVNRLRSCGLNLLVLFDGPDQKMKSDTRAARATDHEEQWAKFYDFCEENVKRTDNDTFPLPPLSSKQLSATLKNLGVACKSCSGEADPDIAKAVQFGNKDLAVGEETHFAYGRDSDYYAMKDCPYIAFGGIALVENEALFTSPQRMRSTPTKASLLRQKPTHQAVARVWRRIEICEALGVSENTFLTWIVLIGNDYTGHFDRHCDFNIAVPSELRGHRPGVLEELLAVAAVAAEEGVVVGAASLTAIPAADLAEATTVDSADNPEIVVGSSTSALVEASVRSSEHLRKVQLAVDYSLAVYQLQDLDHFPLDSGINEHETDEDDRVHASNRFFDFSIYDTPWVGEDGEVEEGYFATLPHYAASQAGSSGKVKLSGLAEHALMFLKQRNSSVESNSDCATKSSNEDTVVTDEHLAALTVMLRQIYLYTEAAKDNATATNGTPASAKKTPFPYASELITAEFPYRPRWADAVAAYVFQRTCSALLKFLPNDAYRTKNNAPRHMFNGALFHRILMLQRAEKLEPVGPSRVEPTIVTTAQSVVGGDKTAVVGSNLVNTDTPPGEKDTPMLSLAEAMRMLTVDNNNNAQPPAAAEDTTLPDDTTTTSPTAPVHDILPIDAFREEILSRIHRDRVTIIHGETGCGKSSCLPRFLLEEGERTGVPVQIMVSQPRRIAVTSLLRRLRTTLGDKVGMRMGHGIKDETKNTKIHYVTTGYLVRALAHQPDRFHKCTHLIIDEVHERSVDGDLVCLLARDLLRINPTIRVVLMSATIHTSLYRDYFASRNDGTYGDMECLSVGVRRFPVTIQYAEDLEKFGETVNGNGGNSKGGSTREKAFGSQVQSAAHDLVKLTKSHAPEVPAKLGLAQYKAAVALVRAIGVEGTGILIFVSGINDITEIVTMLEPYPKFLVFPIHSDIPADEQELAFGVTPDDKVKVVVATNAAESSVTIPDCDVVICLGTHKSLQYSALNHRTQLVNTWISKASATQRAGRTGRVRPGRVYRLYSKNLFENFTDHEQAEVHRRPLQDVLLSMWVMLEDSANFTGVTPFLQGLIEAPDMRNITQSYQYLYESDLITDPNDSGYLTAMGRLSGELPVDIALGRMIAYGVMLGVAAEAVVLAAALSLPKAPFRYANSIYSTPDEYNQIVRNKFLTASEFDQGSYSEPIMLLRLLLKWRTLNPSRLGEYCAKRGLLQAVMRQFKSMAEHLCHTVDTRLAKFRPNHHDTNIHGNNYSTHNNRSPRKNHYAATPDKDATLSKSVDLDSIGELTDTKLNLLRMILLWSSSGNVLKMTSKSKKKLSDTSVLVHSSEVTASHMQDIFGHSVPYSYINKGRRVYDAKVLYWESGNYFNPLVRLMDNLCAVSDLLALQCAWVVVKSSSDHSTLVAFAYLNTHKTTIEASLIEHVFSHPARLQSGQAIATAIVEAGHFMSNITVVVVPDVSKSELKKLNDFRDLIDVSLSVLIPVIGNAKVTAVNCVPSEPTLQQLFFGDEGTESVVTAAQSDKERKIAVQITHSRSVLTFPEDHTASDDDDSLSAMPLIEDLPLGHRLISCCQQQVGKSRNKVLMLNAQDSSETAASGGHGKGVAVPGSIEYAHQQLQRLSKQGTTNDTAEASTHDNSSSNAARKIEVKLGVIGATWVNIRALKTTPSARNQEDQHSLKSVNAILPRQSMLSVSYHRGTETLFAVTHSTLVLGVSGDLVACEGVSFLPPGPSWLYLALLCAGADASQVSLFCPEDRLEISKAQIKRANKVAEMFRTASAIVTREDIVNLVEGAFYGSTFDDGESESEGESNCDSGGYSSDGSSGDGDFEAAWQEAELRMLLEMQLETDLNITMNRNAKKGKKCNSDAIAGKKGVKGEKKSGTTANDTTPSAKKGNKKKANYSTSGDQGEMHLCAPSSEVPLVVQQARRARGLLAKKSAASAAADGAARLSGTPVAVGKKKQGKGTVNHFEEASYFTEVTPVKVTSASASVTPGAVGSASKKNGTTPKKAVTPQFKPAQVVLKRKTPTKKTLSDL